MRAAILLLAMAALLTAQVDANWESSFAGAGKVYQTGITGIWKLTQSPPPGSFFQGDGQAVLKVAGDDISIVGCRFDGVSLQSLADVRGTKIVGNDFRRLRKKGDCYYGGGQAIQVSNERDAPQKLIVGNTVEDYDCIAVSLYNVGPVHNVVVASNTDDGSGLWGSYGPAPEAFSNVEWVGNHFYSPVRIGHGHWMPMGTGVTVAGNIFERYVLYDFRNAQPEAVECGNEYREKLEMPSLMFLPRSRIQACPASR